MSTMNTPVVLITGALTGIGRATAIAFAQEGARIVISGRHEDAGQTLAAELRDLGAEAEFIRADVRAEDDVRALVDRTVARFGQLDTAVNNAGTEGKPGPVTEQSRDSFAATFDTNVLGTVLSMKHEMRVMQEQGNRQCFLDVWPQGCGGCVDLHGQQARGRRPDKGGGYRRRGIQYPRQRGRARSGRNRDAEPLHRKQRT
jgi:NAD(P)-dependent dehydrogenase (short-subunit alcohol dehydrogenase family)